MLFGNSVNSRSRLGSQGRSWEKTKPGPPRTALAAARFYDFIEAIENPDHDRHEELLEWIGGEFDPEAFDPVKATKAMKKGQGDWRKEAW